jgi:hypothetical protein
MSRVMPAPIFIFFFNVMLGGEKVLKFKMGSKPARGWSIVQAAP